MYVAAVTEKILEVSVITESPRARPRLVGVEHFPPLLRAALNGGTHCSWPCVIFLYLFGTTVVVPCTVKWYREEWGCLSDPVLIFYHRPLAK